MKECRKDRQKRLIEVYDHLRQHFGIHTKTGFAEAVKYGRTSMSAALNGKEEYLTDDLFENICEEYPVFNIDYLLTGDGDKVLFIGQRIKTRVTFWVQLLPPALAAVEKYGGQMPRVAVQVYNRNLKALAEMAKIRKKVTSHVARHTFATWMLSNGAKIENVSKMLGHTDIKMTQRYAKVLAKDVFSEFDKVK